MQLSKTDKKFGQYWHTNHSVTASLRHHLITSNKGFSLIETLMALFVLIVGVVGSFAVVSQAIRTSPGARQELIATQLAQEGVEIARNIRDVTLLKIGDARLQDQPLSKNWTTELKHCGSDDTYQTHLELEDKDDISKGWRFEGGCGTTGDRYKIFQEPTTGFMSSLRITGPSSTDGWEDTGFRRKFEIAKFGYTDAICRTIEATPSNNNCDASTCGCAEVRIKVRVYWNTDTMPAVCPGPNCVLAEDRLNNWIEYLGFIL